MYIDEIKKRFADDLFATQSAGIVPVEAGEGYAVCRLEINQSHRNAMGGLMGGVVFTLCDFAFAIASNGLDKPYTMTLSSSISFLSQPKGKIVTARADKIKEGHHASFYEVTVTDEFDNIIARALFNGYRISGEEKQG